MKRIVIIVLTLAIFALPGLAEVDPDITIQGVLTDNAGIPLPDDEYSVRFKLYNASTGGTAMHSELVDVFQMDRVFSAKLTNIYWEIFDQNLWLEMTPEGEAPMIPRVPLNPVPVALRAATVDPSKAVTGLNNLRGNVTLVAGPNVTLTYPGGDQIVISAAAGPGGDDGDWAINGADLTHNTSGTVAIGTNTPLQAFASNAMLQVQSHLYPGLALDVTSPTFARWLMLHNGSSGDLLFARNTTSGLGTPILYVDDDGQVGVGHTPETTLDIDGGNYLLGETNPGDFQIGNNGNALQFGVDVDGTNGGRAKIRAVGTAPLFNLGVGYSDILSIRDNNLNIYFGNELKADFWGGDVNDQGGRLSLYGLTSTATVQLDGYSGSGGSVYVKTSAGLPSASMTGTGTGGLIQCRDAQGNITVTIDGQYSDGSGRIQTEVLEITGGSDLSEQFTISLADQMRSLEPGLVVSIDPENPGELQVCQTAYDRKVAGVISGAGGVRPGMLMGQKGSVADGAHPVALTGRVYVQADAEGSPIEPGDLLTSSAVPGHAMKVTDHSRANGAILGKAMTGLTDGQGLVLVLVSLQ